MPGIPEERQRDREGRTPDQIEHLPPFPVPGQLHRFQRAGQRMDQVHHQEVCRPQPGRDETHDAEPVCGFLEEVLGQALAADRRGLGRWGSAVGLEETGIGMGQSEVVRHRLGKDRVRLGSIGRQISRLRRA